LWAIIARARENGKRAIEIYLRTSEDGWQQQQQATEQRKHIKATTGN
jgi:hypothetical protein